MSLAAFQATFTWLQLAAAAVTPVGADGGVVSAGNVVVVLLVVAFVVDVVVVVVVVVVVGHAVATTTRTVQIQPSTASLRRISTFLRRAPRAL